MDSFVFRHDYCGRPGIPSDRRVEAVIKTDPTAHNREEELAPNKAISLPLPVAGSPLPLSGVRARSHGVRTFPGFSEAHRPTRRYGRRSAARWHVLSGRQSCCADARQSNERSTTILPYTLIFLFVAIVAGTLGFVTLAGTAGWIAKVLFLVFLVMFVVSLVRSQTDRRHPL